VSIRRSPAPRANARRVFHPTRWLGFASAALVACASVPRVAGAASDSSAPAYFGGTWRLNEQMSDSPQKILTEVRNNGWHGAAGGWNGGMGGMGGGGGYGGGHHHGGEGEGGGRPPGDAEGEGRGGGDSTRAPALNDVTRPPMTILVEKTDSTIVLSERARAHEVLTFGDPTITGAAIEPDVPHAHAKWRGHTLVSERAGPRGKITRTFELTKDGKQLIITTHREGSDGRPPLDFKRVYDHYTGD